MVEQQALICSALQVAPMRVAYRIWTEATYPAFRRAPLPWLLPPIEATPPEVRNTHISQTVYSCLTECFH